MGNLALCGFIIMLLFCNGCAVFIPADKTVQGVKIEQSYIDFIKPGVTTRSEITTKLGMPYTLVDEVNVIVYRWVQLSGYLPWVIPLPPQGAGGIEELKNEKFLLIAFGDDERVIKYEIVSNFLQFFTLKQKAKMWVDERSKVNKIPEEFATIPAPEGKSVIYIYKPKKIFASLVVSVFVDGILLDQVFLDGKYSTVIVSLGLHTICADPYTTNPTCQQFISLENIEKFNVHTDAGKAYYIKIKIETPLSLSVEMDRRNSKIILSLEPEEKAIPELKKTKHATNMTL